MGISPRRRARPLAQRLGDDNALFVPTDVTQRDAVNALVGGCVQRFGVPDIVINNAGVTLLGNIEERYREDMSGLRHAVALSQSTFAPMLRCSTILCMKADSATDDDGDFIINRTFCLNCDVDVWYSLLLEQQTFSRQRVKKRFHRRQRMRIHGLSGVHRR